jgi:hypothetical protein
MQSKDALQTFSIEDLQLLKDFNLPIVRNDVTSDLVLSHNTLREFKDGKLAETIVMMEHK